MFCWVMVDIINVGDENYIGRDVWCENLCVMICVVMYYVIV